MSIKVKNEVTVYERDCQRRKEGEPEFEPLIVTNHYANSAKVNLLCGGIILTVKGEDLILAAQNAMRWRSPLPMSEPKPLPTPACKIEGHTIGGWDGEKHWCVECTAEVENNRKTPLAGKTFVFTGCMKQGTRAEYEERVRKLGGKCAATVSDSVDCVVYGSTPGVKLKKAYDLMVPTHCEHDFLIYLKSLEEKA